MQYAPPTLNSCILPNACKKIEIMKIKAKLNGYFPKNVGFLPTIAFVYSRWLDFMNLLDPPVGSLPLDHQ